MNSQLDINLLNSIINKDEKIVYLVGAGISMDPPSSLPSAAQFSRILLGYCTPKEEVDSLLSLPGLRYELVVERVQKNCDKNLDFLNYLELIKTPNIIHFFLGNEIINHHPVITTNFDFLIEYALKKILSESQHSKIFPIISKQDYLENTDYCELYDRDKFPLYKIHGSKKSIITGEDTTPSLITTLSSLGKNREEGETFAIEPFKKELIYNLLDNGTLIVMGYSGSDAFDVGPLLENFPTLKQMIWIDHVNDDEFVFHEILPSNESDSKDISTCESYLTNIRNSNPYKIYYIKTSTSEFVLKFLWPHLINIDPPNINLNITQNEKPPEFKTWVESIFAGIIELRKYNIAIRLYDELGNIEKGIECAQKGLKLAEKENDQKFKAIFLNTIGLYNSRKGYYDEALRLIEESVEIRKKLDGKLGLGKSLNSIGFIHSKKGDLRKALEFHEKAKKIFEEIQNLTALANVLNNIGTIYSDLDEIEKALEQYETALLLYEKIGDLSGKANLLNNMGDLYGMKLKNIDKALRYHQEALKINEELGNLPRQALNLNNIATVYIDKKMYSQAYDTYLKALKIFTKIGDLEGINGIYSNLGSLKEDEDKIDEAIDWTLKALKIIDKLGNNIHRSENQIQLGRLYTKQNDFNSAISLFQDAFNSAQKANYPIYMLSSLYYLAGVYYDLEEFELAINSYKSALELEIKEGNKKGELIVLWNIADSYRGLNDFNNAIKHYEKAFKLAQDLSDKEESAALLNQIGLIQIDQSKFSDAIDTFAKIMNIQRDLKDASGLQKTMGSLGYCSVAISDYSSAKIFYEKALALAKKLNSEEDIQVLQENL